MTFRIDDELRIDLELAKAGDPREDAFEMWLKTLPFPNVTKRYEIKGVPPFELTFRVSATSGLAQYDVHFYEAAEHPMCDVRGNEAVILVCAGEIEKIAQLPEVLEMRKLDQGGHLLEEFNRGRAVLLRRSERRVADNSPQSALRNAFNRALREPIPSLRRPA